MQVRFPRKDLVSILIQDLTLQTHGLTGALHYCSLFEEWSSTDPLDVPFGASLWSTSDTLKGSNSFLFLSSVETCSQELLETLMESLDTKDKMRLPDPKTGYTSLVSKSPHFL